MNSCWKLPLLALNAIDALGDSDFDLGAHCSDAVGTILGSGESYTCVFTEFISGDYSGPAHENTATVTASDNDGNSDTESDDETVTFIDVQLSHGARAFQLFDSWAGSLSVADYDRFVFPHSRRVFDELAARHPGVPGIHFGIGCDHLLERMYAAGPQVIGLDWRTPIGRARQRLGAGTVVQGNLDPALVLAGEGPALAGARAVLADNAGHPGHIFNLGHGVQPDTDPGVLGAIVDLVHELTTAAP